ncbi:MAG TPA: DUF502 domain-containing protein [Planctomycetota bacterium]|nr:DUF502 domain-containing protein [Planctomycetota bacterium]
MLGYLTRYFLRGLLIVVPVGLTIYVFFRVLDWVDGLRKIPALKPYLDYPGMGLLITLVLITLVGSLATNFLAQQALKVLEGWVGRLPVVKLVYNSIRDLTDAFVGDKKSFDQPVWFLESDTSQVKRMGFVTRRSMEQVGLEGHVAVYLPLSFTFGGFLVLVPRDNVHAIDLDSGEMMALIVSGGVSGGKSTDSGHARPAAKV